MKWFRLYSSVLHDPKVQRLSPVLFKHWVNLLCLANEAEPRGVLPSVEDIAFALRIKPSEAIKMLAQLRQVGLIDRVDDGCDVPHNWPQRQRESDDIAARVRRHRAANSPSSGRELAADSPQDNTASDTTQDAQRRSVAASHVAGNGHVTLQATLLKRPVDTDGDGETEPDTESERDSAAGAAAVSPRAPARPRATAAPSAATPASASNSASSGDEGGVVLLCERIAQRTHLPQRVEVMDQLSAIIQSHLARGLSPGDIQRQVLNLIDPTRPRHIARPTISQISNWLARAHPAENLSALVTVSASNGHRPSRGDAANGHDIRRRRQPDLPDSTQHGQYAHLIAVASDDDPDDAADG